MPITPLAAPPRTGTAAEWAATTLVLGDGEVGFDTTTNIFRVGNGVDTWASLGVVPGGNSGTAKTIPESALGGAYNLLLTGTPVVLTFPTAGAGAFFQFRATQDGTGTRLITWPGVVKWPAGTAPTLTTTASRSDAFEFTCFDGTNWYGHTIGLNYNP
jgi:hypothetical protein